MTQERKGTRQEFIANFQFYVDGKSAEVFDGVTVNVSPLGFCFLTRAHVQAGQTITITRHSVHDYAGQSLRVIWVKNEASHFEAGASL